MRNGLNAEDLFRLFQRMILLNDDFDLSLIYTLRKLGKNFIMAHKDIEMNGLPLEMAPIVEEVAGATDLNGYIKNILMKMNEDAQGVLLSLLPICLRINVDIVNIDTSVKSRNKKELWIQIQEGKSILPDLSLKINDSLNFHDKRIFVIRKDGHYDAIFHKDSSHRYEYLSTID